jgi:heme-degrading monooxygenase HmoA
MIESSSLLRIDKFVVPASSREEFLRRVRETHDILRLQSGFVRDAILEQYAGPGRFNLVTIAEWRSQDDIDKARTAVLEAHAASGFDPREAIERLGIEADIAYYRQL